MYPDGYTNQTGFPNLRTNEHFQVWMRVAALPTFRKLWARNDQEVMTSGMYRVVANMSEQLQSSNPLTDCSRQIERLSRQAVLWN
jgi:hypothetical protein